MLGLKRRMTASSLAAHEGIETTPLFGPSAAPRSIAGTAKSSNSAPISNRDANVVALENRMRERFGTKVQIRYRQGKGSLEIKFFNDGDLNRILQLLGVKVD